MKCPNFFLGFSFILIGLAIGAGLNYLDMRQFETQIPGYATTGWSPSDASGIYQSLKSKDGFSQKYFSPEISAYLMRDYSTMDYDIRGQFQHVRDSVSQKKLQALKSMGTLFLLVILAVSMNFLAARKAQSKPT